MYLLFFSKTILMASGVPIWVVFARIVSRLSTIQFSIILNDVYIGDNTVIENCIVESRDTIRANTTYIGTPENVKIVVEKNERYTL